MALQAQMLLDKDSIRSGEATHATLLVYNSGATAVAVTGANITIRDAASAQNRIPANAPIVPCGVGMNTLVPAGGSLTFGPFAITAYNAAARQATQTGSMPLTAQVVVGCEVFGSDRSSTQAGTAPFLLSYYPAATKGTAGGECAFQVATNSGNFLTSFF